MANHPNRSKRAESSARNPTPAQIRAAREAAGLTQTEAAAVLGRSLSWWQRIESTTDSNRRMDPVLWHCWQYWVRGEDAPPIDAKR